MGNHEVTRDVCTACGAIWFETPTDQCPSCKGKVTKAVKCTRDDAGIVKVKGKE